jgi:site-specific recombinase XerD
MTGRQEHNMKIERSITEKLKGASQLIIDYSYNFGNKTERTKEAYINYVLKFFEFFNGKDVLSLRKSDINYYMDTLRYKEDGTERSASFRNATLAAIRDFYQFLVDEERIENNPCASVKPPRDNSEREVVAMTPEDIKTVINNIEEGVGSTWQRSRLKGWKNRDLAIIMLGCTTGLRCSAITEINVEDIDFDNNIIKVIEKGNKGRFINVGAKTMAVINDWVTDRKEKKVNDTDALFINNQGDRMSQVGIAKIVKKYTYNIDKHITPHKMRSSCATNLYEKTGDIYLVQEVLGHKNIANTRRYARASEAKKQQAAAILDGLV